jgi:Flagellar protein YcgR/PilZ domain
MEETCKVRVSLTSREKERIVVGQPLPFSVFSAEGNLLLAAGRVVESDYARQILLNNGACRNAAARNSTAVAAEDETKGSKVSPLTLFQNSYRKAKPVRGLPLSMARNETSEAFRTHVVGVYRHILIVHAPLRSDGALVAVIPGQAWLCRTFQGTSAFRFQGTVLKVGFEPFPHLYVEVPTAVTERKIRNRTRATVLVAASIELPVAAPCVVIDLSVGGGRIATADEVVLEQEQPIRISLSLSMIGTRFNLSLKAVVARVFGANNHQHPRVAFYGVKFESLAELDSCVLHGFVNSQLALELNSLWQVLSMSSPMDAEYVLQP